MRAFAVEKKMHYPVMTEKQVAARWKVSPKTLRRWRLDNEGPVWRKLFRLVRYHEADVVAFEKSSSQFWGEIFGGSWCLCHAPRGAIWCAPAVHRICGSGY
jgi:hypothetical protein